MTEPGCSQPLAFETLVAYWLGELAEPQMQAVDLHLLGCDSCGAEADALAALAGGVRAAFDAGLVGSVVDGGFVRHLQARGLRVREYRVAAGGSVNCSVAPDDDVVVSRLGASLAGVTRLDLVRVGAHGEPDLRAADIPFEGARDEVLVVVPAARLRELPDGVERVRLLAVDRDGERVVGDYAFNHRRAPGATPSLGDAT